MPEGPSIVIAREKLEVFVGKKVIAASGTAAIDMSRLKGAKILRIRTWGKHLLLVFEGFTVRVHFLMFGTYYINERKALKPRLSLKFSQGKEMNIYTSSIKMIEEPLSKVYDWTADIMHRNWDKNAARKKLKSVPDAMIADVLMDQEIFPGVGNIIKNEVLYRVKLHPASRTGDIPPAKITAMMKEIRNYAFEFLEQRREGTLTRNWKVYTKKKCGRDGAAIQKGYLGKLKRRCFYCDECQVRY